MHHSAVEVQLLRAHDGAGAAEEEPLRDVAQLAEVAGPGVAAERTDGGGVEGRGLPGREQPEQALEVDRDLVRHLAERGEEVDAPEAAAERRREPLGERLEREEEPAVDGS